MAGWYLVCWPSTNLNVRYRNPFVMIPKVGNCGGAIGDVSQGASRSRLTRRGTAAALCVQAVTASKDRTIWPRAALQTCSVLLY